MSSLHYTGHQRIFGDRKSIHTNCKFDLAEEHQTVIEYILVGSHHMNGLSKRKVSFPIGETKHGRNNGTETTAGEARIITNHLGWNCYS